jgi:hypothetical protein
MVVVGGVEVFVVMVVVVFVKVMAAEPPKEKLSGVVEGTF